MGVERASWFRATRSKVEILCQTALMMICGWSNDAVQIVLSVNLVTLLLARIAISSVSLATRAHAFALHVDVRQTTRWNQSH